MANKALPASGPKLGDQPARFTIGGKPAFPTTTRHGLIRLRLRQLRTPVTGSLFPVEVDFRDRAAARLWEQGARQIEGRLWGHRPPLPFTHSNGCSGSTAVHPDNVRKSSTDGKPTFAEATGNGEVAPAMRASIPTTSSSARGKPISSPSQNFHKIYALGWRLRIV